MGRSNQGSRDSVSSPRAGRDPPGSRAHVRAHGWGPAGTRDGGDLGQGPTPHRTRCQRSSFSIYRESNEKRSGVRAGFCSAAAIAKLDRALSSNPETLIALAPADEQLGPSAMAHWNHTTCLRTLTEQRDERREVSKPLVSRAERVDEHHCVLGKVLSAARTRQAGRRRNWKPKGFGNA